MEYNVKNIAEFVATILEASFSWRVTPINDSSFKLEVGNEAHDEIRFHYNFVVEFDENEIRYEGRTFYRADFELWTRCPELLEWWRCWPHKKRSSKNYSAFCFISIPCLLSFTAILRVPFRFPITYTEKRFA